MVKLIINLLLTVAVASMLGGCASSNQQRDNEDGKSKINLLVLENNAQTAYQSGQLELAEGLYRQLLSHRQNYAPAWFKLGNIYTRTNRLDAAVNAYQNCINSDREYAKAWHNLAIARVRQATDILIEAQNHLVVDSGAKERMDGLFMELMRIQSMKTPANNVASND